jgi:RND family efflux transporter MFP subunit
MRSRPRWSRIPSFVAPAAIAIAAVLAGCGPQGGAPHGGGMPPAVVAVQEVKPRTVAVEFEYPAQTAGSREVEVRARVSGILLKRNFTEGAPVRAGQSLFSLDAAPYEAAAARAEADVAAAEARLASAARNAKRMKPLFEARAVSQREFDEAISAEDVGAADVKAARARLAEARLQLGYTKVESPVSGVTSRALKSEGSLIPGPEVLLTTVSQVDPIYVNFGLSEAEQSRLKRDADAGKLDASQGHALRRDHPLRGRHDVLAARASSPSPTVRVNNATGHARCARRASPIPEGRVRPGQFVRAILKGRGTPERDRRAAARGRWKGPQGKHGLSPLARQQGDPGARFTSANGRQRLDHHLGPQCGRQGDRRSASRRSSSRGAGAGRVIQCAASRRAGRLQGGAMPPRRPGAQSKVTARRPRARNNVLALLHRPPDLRGRHLALHRARGPRGDARASHRAVSGDRAAAGRGARVYPGASATVLEQTVAAPLENAINGVEDMLYMSSTSSSEGVVTITVTFNIGVDADKAGAQRQQPREAGRAAPAARRRAARGSSVEKGSQSFLQVIAVYSPDGSRDDLFTSNYTTLNILDQVKRVPGTTNVQVFGAKDYAMRVWLRPDRLAQLKLSPGDIARAINEQNAQFAAGKVGEPPTGGGQELVYTITTRGRLSEPKEFEDIILRSNPDGSRLRLGDVARVELASRDYGFIGRVNNKSTAMIGIFLQPKANALDVAKEVNATMARLEKSFPSGIKQEVVYDTTRFVEVSIREVMITLGEAMLLVFLVVFLFLQNWRATLIPSPRFRSPCWERSRASSRSATRSTPSRSSAWCSRSASSWTTRSSCWKTSSGSCTRSTWTPARPPSRR